MPFQPGYVRLCIRVLGVTLLTVGWLINPFQVPELLAQASPPSQASPAPRVTATPAATPTLDEQLQELQRRKLNREMRLIDTQVGRLRQEQDIASQAWRETAEAVASFGPTLIGLSLLYLLARALTHWLPKAESQGTVADADDDG